MWPEWREKGAGLPDGAGRMVHRSMQCLISHLAESGFHPKYNKESSRDRKLWGPRDTSLNQITEQRRNSRRGDSHFELWRMSERKPIGGRRGSEVQIPWIGPNSNKDADDFQ